MNSPMKHLEIKLEDFSADGLFSEPIKECESISGGSLSSDDYEDPLKDKAVPHQNQVSCNKKVKGFKV